MACRTASDSATGLLTEEVDVLQRQLLGNLPPAFVHAVLLETSAALAGCEAPALVRTGPSPDVPPFDGPRTGTTTG